MNSAPSWFFLLLSFHASRCMAPSSLAVNGFAYHSMPYYVKRKLSMRSSCQRIVDSSFRRCRCRGQRPMLRQQRRWKPLHNHPRLKSNQCEVFVRSMANSAINEATSNSEQSEYIWDVYVSQPSSKSEEKTVIPSSSIIQAFISLSPPSEKIRVYPAVFHKQNKQKGKGHSVRCVQRKRNIDGGSGDEEVSSAMEIGNVDSVDKVYRVMTKHMKLEGINPKACECIRYFFWGNRSLEVGEPSQAIALYDQALSVASQYPSQELPRGSILMQRARAYLKRASKHRAILRMHVNDLMDTVPSTSTMKILYQAALAHPALSFSIFNRLAGDSKIQQMKFRQVRYRHDMYEFASLHAVQDSLQATQILPHNAHVWLLAGKSLAELRKLKESNQYYQRALEIDPSMKRTLKGVMEKNRVSQEFMDMARASGFSGDTLRLALDVAT